MKALGYIMYVLSGIWLFLAALFYFYAKWGIIGLLAGIFVPPLFIFFPIIFWIVEGFAPVGYFIIWGIGCIGIFLSTIDLDEENYEQIEEKENLSLLEETMQLAERKSKKNLEKTENANLENTVPHYSLYELHILYENRKSIESRTKKRLAELGIDVDEKSEEYQQILKEEEREFLNKEVDR